MVEPGVMEVNADDTADQVLERVVDLLRQHSLLLPHMSSSASSSAAAAATTPTTD